MVGLRRSLTVAVSIVLATSGAQAALTTYADRPSWEAGVGSFDVEDFETTPLQRLPCPVPHDVFSGQGCPVETRVDAPKLDIVLGAYGHGTGGIFEPGMIDGSREF